MNKLIYNYNEEESPLKKNKREHVENKLKERKRKVFNKCNS